MSDESDWDADVEILQTVCPKSGPILGHCPFVPLPSRGYKFPDGETDIKSVGNGAYTFMYGLGNTADTVEYFKKKNYAVTKRNDGSYLAQQPPPLSMQLSNLPPGEAAANTTPSSISSALRRAEQQAVPADVVNRINWVRKQSYSIRQEEFREKYRDPVRRAQMKEFLLRPDVRPRGEAQNELLQEALRERGLRRKPTNTEAQQQQ